MQLLTTVMELLRLEKPFNMTKSIKHHQCVHHVPKCHIHVGFEHFQAW